MALDLAADEQDRPLGAAVITPVGTFPGETEYQRVYPNDRISSILVLAANKFALTNTADWVAHVADRQINTERTFREEGLLCVVDIEWHKPEGGGGARYAFPAQV